MGATSVTGVGAGAAEPNRGPGNNRNQYVSLLDPHVVYSGTVNTLGGTNTVILPPAVKDLPENLTLICGGKGYCSNKNLDGDGLVESFSVTGAKKTDLDFIVVKDPSTNFNTNL
jgi:hypothetical protein